MREDILEELGNVEDLGASHEMGAKDDVGRCQLGLLYCDEGVLHLCDMQALCPTETPTGGHVTRIASLGQQKRVKST